MSNHLYVSSYYCQSNISLETMDAVVETTIQAMIFQSVYWGLNGWMFVFGLDKFFWLLNFFVDRRQPSFSGKNDFAQYSCEFLLVLLAVEAFVKTAAPEIRKSSDCFLYYRNCYLVISFILLPQPSWKTLNAGTRRSNSIRFIFRSRRSRRFEVYGNLQWRKKKKRTYEVQWSPMKTWWWGLNIRKDSGII